MKDKIMFWLGVDYTTFSLAYSLQEKIDCDMYAIIDITKKPKVFFNENDAKKFTTKNPSFKLNVKNITVDREKAVDGFKSAIFEYLINGKTQFGPEKKFKFYDIYNTLFEKKMSQNDTLSQ